MMKRLTLGLAIAAGLALAGPGTALADRSAGGQILVISDEIWGRSVDVERPDADGGSDSVAEVADVADTGKAKSNNGHGNNADGVDSSNPGQGKGGPNGATDASCDGSGACVDDESSGGGSVMSASNGKSNKGKKK